MKLFLMRHGEAEAVVTTDAERALTETGREQAAQTAVWIQQQLKEESVALFCSTYRRANETANIIGERLGVSALPIDRITPEDDPRSAWKSIESALSRMDDRITSVVVVSHMPLVAALTGWLTDGVSGTGRGFLLAEVRLLHADLLEAGLAEVTASFVP